MKYLFLPLALLLLASAPAFSQTQPAPTAAAATPAAPDTVAALHRLFAGRRHRRNAIAIGLGAGLVLNVIDASLTAEDKAAGHPPIFDLDSAPGHPAANVGGVPVATTWLLAVLPTSALIGIDYLAYSGFTRKREARAVAAYQAGKLPKSLKKLLRAKHFRTAPVR